MGVDGGVAGRPRQVLPLSVGDVLPVSLNVPLGQSKVDEKNLVGGLVESYAEVIGFDISMQEMSVMDVLNSIDHLINKYEHGFQ